VHTLKGVSGNLGMTKLFEACAYTTELLRSGENEKAAESCGDVEKAYYEVVSVISG
jgi:HPt (histidine-containing phosphotransfer) domain-containing protein